MAEPHPASGGFPDQHTTSTYTTVTQQQSTSSGVRCTIDRAFPLSLPGILMIVQMVLGFLYWTVVFSYYSSYYVSWRGFIVSVAISAWVFTTIFFCLYLFALTKRVTIINWPLTGLINNALWCLLHFIAAILISIQAGRFNVYEQGGKLVWGSVCGWALFVLYGVSTLLNFRDFQAMGGISSVCAPGQSATTTAYTSTTVISTTGTTGEKSAQDPPPFT